jgi:hypothetical protein
MQVYAVAVGGLLVALLRYGMPGTSARTARVSCTLLNQQAVCLLVASTVDWREEEAEQNPSSRLSHRQATLLTQQFNNHH